MRSKRIFPLLLCVLLVVGLLPLSAAAMSIDTGRDCTLTVNLLDNGVPVTGFPFALYYVASVSSEGTFTPAGDFRD